MMIGPEAPSTGQNLIAVEAVGDEDWTHSTGQDPGYGEVLREVEGSSNVLGQSEHVGLLDQIPDQDFVIFADYD